MVPTILNMYFTPFRIEDAEYATPSSLITAHFVGVLNEKRCNNQKVIGIEKLRGDGANHLNMYLNTVSS